MDFRKNCDENGYFDIVLKYVEHEDSKSYNGYLFKTKDIENDYYVEVLLETHKLDEDEIKNKNIYISLQNTIGEFSKDMFFVILIDGEVHLRSHYPIANMESYTSDLYDALSVLN